MPTNTRDIGCCNLCGIKCIGVETKIKLWLKLHYKQNHPNDKIVSVGMEIRNIDKTSRRWKNKEDYKRRQKFDQEPGSYNAFTA